MPGFEQGQNTVRKMATFMVRGWFLLESAKDRFIGVSPPEQHVPPGVQYGTTCILISEHWVYILFESNGEGYGYTWDPPRVRGARDGESLVECKTDPKGPLSTTCSDFLASHQRKCDCAWPAWQH
jgi:hypothetical protein